MKIKIRAWDKDSETMIYGVGITPESDGGIPYQIPVNAHDFDQFDYYPNSIIMQYTGLKDKNGTEIYEGDITKTIDGLGVIIYEPKLATFAIEYRSYKITIPHYLDSERGNDLEVLGNIYEHPHLLGGEEQ